MTKQALLPILLFTLAGCGSTEDAAPASCDARAKLDGVCPGVASGAVTTDGIACSMTIGVASPAELDAKAASAAAGACLVLAAGDFGVVTLPAGVSLVGKGSSSTSVAGIKTTGADAATIRGVKVKGGGIAVSGKGNLSLDRVHIVNTAPKTIGISAIDTSVTVVSSTVADGSGFGIAAQCKTDCTTARPTLTLRRVMVSNNKVVGVWAHGANAVLEGVQVSGTKTENFQYGRGIEVAEGASLKASHIAAIDNQDVGIYIDGGAAEIVGFNASGNVRGVQLQAIPAAGAKLEDFVIENNSALGLGITKGSLGIIVQGGLVASTKAMKVPVDIGGLQEVGDGINWLGGSEATIAASVKIQSSARRGVIIEADSKGKFEGTLGGGDDTRGIIVQGGLEASMPSTLSVASGVKAEVLTKDKSMPVAVTMAASKSP